MYYAKLRDIQQTFNITQPQSRGADTRFKVRLALMFMLSACGASVGCPLWDAGTLVSSGDAHVGSGLVTSVLTVWWAFDYLSEPHPLLTCGIRKSKYN